MTCRRNTCCLVDNSRKRLAVLVPPPLGWDEPGGVITGATSALEEGARAASFDDEHQHHRRGNFRVFNHGLGFGGGRTAVGMTSNTRRNQRVLEDLTENASVKRIAGFQNSERETSVFCLKFSPSWRHIPHLHACSMGILL